MSLYTHFKGHKHTTTLTTTQAKKGTAEITVQIMWGRV